jgi:hypothetical protein
MRRHACHRTALSASSFFKAPWHFLINLV